MAEVPIGALWRSFARIGLLSFGGPAAQIALMHRVLVEERRWLDEASFLRALSFCMLLPGPEAMQLATYAGWRLRGVTGGIIAGGLFVLPGALVMGALALAYAMLGTAPDMQAALTGIKAAVIAIVAQAVWRLSQKALSDGAEQALAAAAFVALFVFGAPFPLVILAAAGTGWWRARASLPAEHPAPISVRRPWRAVIWLVLWLAPIPILFALGQDLLAQIAVFFAKLAALSFGGAYALLAWMTQEAVTAQGWLTAEQMVDALGLAETTPGPLILVTQFVAMLAGFGAGGTGLALLAGAITLWMTFVPCFVLVFAGAPFIETLLHRPRIAAALKAITAAVVGVIASLSLWFAIHVLFAATTPMQFGAITLDRPVWGSLSWGVLGLVILGAGLLGPLRRGVVFTLLTLAATAWLAGRLGLLP
ncbi:chromate efflux transporter [Cognatishimia sp. F0-27]|uniref:chromate efflux transporter n=1 Tax=Cognatishimia sp. F0-27 TaxID=2816855 RepID=UPI001D0CDCB6|nr:chromate efflux transporter [Cognatishimia sp. F0-27]MCC1494482.1 chromate efflux transporter [Cognatishimia sp. F0-27]